MQNPLILFPVLCVNAVVGKEKPWQKIMIPSAAKVASTFHTPPPEYGLVLWWGWTGHMTEKVITQDLDEIKARGIRSVMIEAGYGLEPRYLSTGWFEAIRLAVKHARSRGMRIWLVDEGKYPSGFAGEKFSAERPDLRMQALLVAERIDVASGETLSRQLPPETMGAIAVNLKDESSQVLAMDSGELHWTVPEGKWQVLLVQHQFRTSVTRYVHNPTREKDTSCSLCDYLNPEATRQFLAFTHEQYKKYLHLEFGSTVLGFRGDEPDFARTPWTPELPAKFQRRKGYDVRPYLASFFAPELTEEVRRAKADYWDVWSDLFRESFFRIQAEWCADNNLEYLVHLNHEHNVAGLVRSEGDFFKAMRHVQIPGVDAIWNQIWPGEVADFPKLASSAAHLFGRPRAFSESFAAYRTRPTVEQARWVINYQFVRGINLLEVMFYPSSASVDKRSGWLASDEFPELAEYVNRSSYLLSQGQPTARIALYFPTSSLWLGDEEADTSTWNIARGLLERQRDFDFVDEQSLSSILELGNGTLTNLSGQSYQAVIIPSISVISKASLDRLREFAKTGGSVIFLGREPSLMVERTFLKAKGSPNLNWAVREPSGKLTDGIMESLPQPGVLLDRSCPSVKYLHRRWSDADLYFFFNEGDWEQSFQTTLTGNGQVQFWDAALGHIEVLAGVSSKDGTVHLPLVLGPYDSQFVVIGPAMSFV